MDAIKEAMIRDDDGLSAQANTPRFEEPDGYSYGVVKVDRRIDVYMAGVETPAKYNYSGLFSSKEKALSWCRHIVARDRRQPLFPYPQTESLYDNR